MTAPFFSILITAYNAKDWIVECLESVFGQDVKDYECLIGDDASTDDTRDIVRDIMADDQRFRMLESPWNRGGGQNLAELIAEARGEIIVELGADDYFVLPTALTRIRAEYERYPKCDATSGSFVIVPDSGVFSGKPDPLWWKAWCFGKPLTFRRELALRGLEEFKDAILDPETGQVPRYGWDVAIYWPVVALARRYRTIYDIIYAYRVHEANDHNSHRAEQLVTERRMSEAIDKIMVTKPMPWWSKEFKELYRRG